MTDVRLSKEEWLKFRDFLREGPRAYIGKDEDSYHHFVESVKWVSRSCAQWRLMQAEYGKWDTIYKRFVRWCESGIWERLLVYFADGPDLENHMVDSRIGRAHLWAAGTPRKA
jgi:transposase